jgi:TRAP transporter TAXI family solute receptor
MANFTRVCAWIAHCLYFRIGRAGLCEIHTGQCWVDNIEAVSSGKVDLTISSPIVFAEQAMKGTAQFDRPHPNLRALGVLPHDDAILFAVPAESKISSIEDILEQRYPLRLAISPDDGRCHAGWICQAILDEYGLTRKTIESFGGQYYLREFPRDIPPLVLSGRADAAMSEAMMIPQWWELTEQRPIRFLSISDQVLTAMETKHGYRRRTIQAGKFKHQAAPIVTLDFSDWLIVVTDAMTEAIAYELTSILVDQRAMLEQQFTHVPRERSPLTYPIRPDQMGIDTAIPLHPGAQRFYSERGLL